MEGKKSIHSRNCLTSDERNFKRVNAISVLYVFYRLDVNHVVFDYLDQRERNFIQTARNGRHRLFQHYMMLGTCQKLAGGEGGGVGILNLGSEMR